MTPGTFIAAGLALLLIGGLILWLDYLGGGIQDYERRRDDYDER